MAGLALTAALAGVVGQAAALCREVLATPPLCPPRKGQMAETLPRMEVVAVAVHLLSALNLRRDWVGTEETEPHRPFLAVALPMQVVAAVLITLAAQAQAAQVARAAGVAAAVTMQAIRLRFPVLLTRAAVVVVLKQPEAKTLAQAAPASSSSSTPYPFNLS
jgi:hypothetical protein